MTRRNFAILAGVVALGIGLGVLWLQNAEMDSATREFPKLPDSSGSKSPEIRNETAPKTPDGFEESTGWTVTSYQDVNEAVYDGAKTEVFDSGGTSLGFYRKDFLEQVKIDGSGKGDGAQNSGKFLHYDYDAGDGRTYYLSDKSLGAYDNELVPWTGDKPSIAINPPLPFGTEIKFKDLGIDGAQNADWVVELLKGKTFYADDKLFGLSSGEKHIDIYVGLQKQKNNENAPESLLMHDVTIYMKRK